jgi:hypothetical protein
MNTSDLEDDIKRLMAFTRGQNEVNRDQHLLNCRINPVRHYQLGILADRLNMTRTGLAERLLEQASEIAWNAAGFAALSYEDLDAIMPLTKPGEAPKTETFPTCTLEENSARSAASPSTSLPLRDMREYNPPDRLECFAFIFRHLGLETGRVRQTIALSRDGSVRICCLTSKDHEAEKQSGLGERYWFTIYERHLEDIEQAQKAYVAFACGAAHQVVLIPVGEFRKWCDALPPYTQGNTGWHVHLSKVAGAWTIRREGYHVQPIDVTAFVI